jgi:hypothetical protein
MSRFISVGMNYTKRQECSLHELLLRDKNNLFSIYLVVARGVALSIYIGE